MSILLDTHILLWWLADDSKLPEKARQIIADANKAIYVSTVSLWEIVIKRSKGKIRIDLNELMTAVDKNRFALLPVIAPHVLTVASLPNYHSDPFDRMLIAQAITESFYLLTHDAMLQPYSNTIIVV